MANEEFLSDAIDNTPSEHVPNKICLVKKDGGISTGGTVIAAYAKTYDGYLYNELQNDTDNYELIEVDSSHAIPLGISGETSSWVKQDKTNTIINTNG